MNDHKEEAKKHRMVITKSVLDESEVLTRSFARDSGASLGNE